MWLYDIFESGFSIVYLMKGLFSYTISTWQESSATRARNTGLGKLGLSINNLCSFRTNFFFEKENYPKPLHQVMQAAIDVGVC